MRVDVETIERIQAEREVINDHDFNNIEFYENGEKLEFHEKALDDWEMIGLNNMDFITSGEYKHALKSNLDYYEENQNEAI